MFLFTHQQGASLIAQFCSLTLSYMIHCLVLDEQHEHSLIHVSNIFSVEFCFTAQDHVVTNQPNRSDATVIVVAPSGEAVVCTGKV